MKGGCENKPPLNGVKTNLRALLSLLQIKTSNQKGNHYEKIVLFDDGFGPGSLSERH